MSPTNLGELEQLVLLSLMHLGDDGFGVAVQRDIETRTGRHATLGAVYSALTRLEEKGLVASRTGDPTPERGGRRKKLFRVSAAGRLALSRSLDSLREMSRGLSADLRFSR
jgi:DNA-binding PadR family transcriptional regulator